MYNLSNYNLIVIELYKYYEILNELFLNNYLELINYITDKYQGIIPKSIYNTKNIS